MKLFSFLVLCLALHHPLYAQDTTSRDKVRFGVTAMGGLLAGSSDHSGVLQLVTGLRYKTWSGGVGAGIDYYYERSIPLFLQLKKALFEKPHTPFVYADGGVHLPWLRKDPEKLDWMVQDTEGSFYYEAGIGYEVPLFKNSRVVFSAGYSYKAMEQEVNAMPWLSIWPPPPSAYETFNYEMRRISVKAGIRF